MRPEEEREPVGWWARRWEWDWGWGVRRGWIWGCQPGDEREREGISESPRISSIREKEMMKSKSVQSRGPIYAYG